MSSSTVATIVFARVRSICDWKTAPTSSWHPLQISESSTRFTYHYGVVDFAAVVPPAARGFTVVAPGVDYVDLGTEFGIAVDEATGASELHVFDGQVNATNPSSQKLLSSVTEGEAVTFSKGELHHDGQAG